MLMGSSLPRTLQVLGALLALAAGTLPAMGADESVWQMHMDTARQAEREGRGTDAEASLLAAEHEARRSGSARLLVARSLEALADFYHHTGRHSEAEPLYLRCAQIWEEILGPDQPRVGIPLHNLAVLYLSRCRVAEALPLVHRVLDLWEKTLGPAHPDRVTAIQTEATLLRRCGRATDAATLEARAPVSTSP